jgi:hypothetical protein
MLAFIRSGGYPQVAAEAAGVSRRALRQWLKRGDKKQAREQYRNFARDYRQAVAHARLRAELAAYEKDPKFWLSHGPGKETPDNPGWTTEARAGSGAPEDTESVFQSEEWARIFRVIRQALQAFPEANTAVAEALKQAR